MKKLNDPSWLAEARSYFERGCLCIANGDVNRIPKTTSDEDAVKYYEESCKCSRNYVNSRTGGQL